MIYSLSRRAKWLYLSRSPACSHMRNQVPFAQFSSVPVLNSIQIILFRIADASGRLKKTGKIWDRKRARACVLSRKKWTVSVTKLPSNYQDRISPSGQLLKIQSAAPRKHCVFAWLLSPRQELIKREKYLAKLVLAALLCKLPIAEGKNRP